MCKKYVRDAETTHPVYTQKLFMSTLTPKVKFKFNSYTNSVILTVCDSPQVTGGGNLPGENVV